MDVGHLEIRNDDVDGLRQEVPECLDAVRRCVHLMTVSLQNPLLEQAFRFLVIDDEYVSHDVVSVSEPQAPRHGILAPNRPTFHARCIFRGWGDVQWSALR